MDINTNMDNEEFSYTEKLGSSQALVECDINTGARGGLSRILTVLSDARCTKVDTFLGEAKVYGKVTYKVLYLDESGGLSSIEYSSDFVESIASANVDTNTIAYAMMSIEDVDYMAKGDSIRLQAVVNILLLGVAKNNVDIVSGVENALVKCKDTETSIHIAHIDTKCDVTEDIEIGAKVDKVLLLDAVISVDSAKPSHDTLDISGSVDVNMLYVSDAKTLNKHIDIPFSESVKSLGVDATSAASIVASVESTRCIIGGDEDNNIIRVEVVARCEGDVYEYADTKVIEDVFTPNAELNITRSDVRYTRLVHYKSSDERINGEASVSDAESGIKRIVTCVPMPNVMTNVKVSKGEVKVDSLIDVDIVYINESDEYQVMRVELPESINVPCDDALEGDMAYVRVAIGSVDARIKRDRDVDITLDVTLEMQVVRDVSIDVITAVDKVCDKEYNAKTMGVYFTSKGDTMWDIVKASYMSEDEIRAINPSLDLDNINGTERVLVYRQRK